MTQQGRMIAASRARIHSHVRVTTGKNTGRDTPHACCFSYTLRCTHTRITLARCRRTVVTATALGDGAARAEGGGCSALGTALWHAVSALTPRCALLPLTIPTLNSQSFVPAKVGWMRGVACMIVRPLPSLHFTSLPSRLLPEGEEVTPHPPPPDIPCSPPPHPLTCPLVLTGLRCQQTTCRLSAAARRHARATGRERHASGPAAGARY